MAMARSAMPWRRSQVSPVVANLALPRVAEFYNSILDNYFITADPVEAAAIDNGGAGPGWSRTGNEFFSGGPVAVCRFYGSQSPGPNSHFYTASASECAGLVALQASTPASVPRWNFESNDFLASLSTSVGCPAQTVSGLPRVQQRIRSPRRQQPPDHE
jgi:hypothetical protein